MVNDRSRKSTKRSNPAKSGDLKLRCPFLVHAHKHNHVYDHCQQTFLGIDKLNEHLSRVHSLKYRCHRCKAKFPFTKARDLQVLKQNHGTSCEERPWLQVEEEWARLGLMSDEQHVRWGDWNKTSVSRLPASEQQGKEKKALWSWRKIYKSLFPDTLVFPNSCLEDDLPQGRVENEPPLGSESTSPYRYFADPIFSNPLSSDLTPEQLEWRGGVQDPSWSEDTPGPPSWAFSNTSGSVETLPTFPIPSYVRESAVPLDGVEGEGSDYGVDPLAIFNDPDLQDPWDLDNYKT